MAEMEGDNSPLALNAWDASGPNSYMAAIKAVDVLVAADEDELYGRSQRLTNFIVNALYDRIRSQSSDNHDQYMKVAESLDTKESDFVKGMKSPAELVSFLQRQDRLDSIEIARRTHIGAWNTRSIVDLPIRTDLDTSEALGTALRKSPPLYRIKNLNVADASSQYLLQVDRKRTVRQHFGGSVLTIVRNSVVLHNANDSMPPEVRQIIRDERQDARRKRQQDEPEYDYNRHVEGLRVHLEPHLSHRDTNDKPAWIVPILTTYYAVKAGAIKAERLKQEDSIKSDA